MVQQLIRVHFLTRRKYHNLEFLRDALHELLQMRANAHIHRVRFVVKLNREGEIWRTFLFF